MDIIYICHVLSRICCFLANDSLVTSLTRGGKQEGREKGGGGVGGGWREKELRYLVDENSDLNCLDDIPYNRAFWRMCL